MAEPGQPDGDHRSAPAWGLLRGNPSARQPSDDLSLMAVDAVPEGATLTQWEKQINTAKVTVPREAAPAAPGWWP